VVFPKAGKLHWTRHANWSAYFTHLYFSIIISSIDYLFFLFFGL